MHCRSNGHRQWRRPRRNDDTGTFKSWDPSAWPYRRRRAERGRPHDTQQIAGMDRRVGNANPNLVCPEWLGRALFDPKQFGRLPELVVDDPSHANLQHLSAGRQINPVRFDKIRKTSASVRQ
jgi:hypothetical protein